MKRRTRNVTNKSRANKGHGGLTWKFYTLSILSFVAIVGGFFLAARNHFSSVTYGFANAELRKELENLEAEKRRLILSREVALSPAEIGKAARKLGFSSMTARNIDSFKSSDPLVAKKTAQPSDKIKTTGQMMASLSPSVPSKKEARSGLVSGVVGRSSSPVSRN